MSKRSNWWQVQLSRFLKRIFPKVTDFSLETSVKFNMRSMALQTHPKETFGVLSGRHEGNILLVERIVFQPYISNPRSAHVIIDHYTISDMVGTFHSHPTPNDEPSSADRKLFAQHPGVHCIVAFPYHFASVYDHHGNFLRRESLLDNTAPTN